MLQELSELFAPEKLPGPNEMDRLYIYNVENKFMKATVGRFLGIPCYRTYYLKIVTNDRAYLVRRIKYESLYQWRIRISEINAALQNMHMAMKV